MHVHMSLWKDGANLFAGDGYAGLSEMAMFAIGGLLKHAPSLLAFHQSDHQQLQAAGARIRGPGQPGIFHAESKRRHPYPLYSQSEKAKRIEFRCPDPSCNPYLAFSAMLMAASTVSRTRSIRARPWTRTFTICRLKNWPRCLRRRVPCGKSWGHLRPIMTIC